jgi:hypothetical protein
VSGQRVEPTAERARFVFGPLEKRGLLGGWSTAQVLVIAISLLLAVGVLRAAGGLGGMVMALGIGLVGLVLATFSVNGRDLLEWLPALIKHGFGVISGQTFWHSELPASGSHLVNPAGIRPRERQHFGGISFFSLGNPSSCVGIVHDRSEARLVAVLSVRAAGFVLSDALEQSRRAKAWGDLLASLATSSASIQRIAWVARTTFDDATSIKEHYLGSLRSAHPVGSSLLEAGSKVLGASRSARSSYEDLLTQGIPSGSKHETFLALAIGVPSRMDTKAKQLRARELVMLAEELSRSLQAIGAIGSILSPRKLLDALGGSISPEPRDSSRSGLSRPSSVWPMACQAHWDRIRIDETWRVTYWIAEWPRVPVGPDFLTPVLLEPSVPKSVSLVMAPMSPERARREAERARLDDVVDAEMRRRSGFLSSARKEKEQEAVIRREQELAEGHASFRFSGWVTVTASSEEELESHCESLERSAGRAGVCLRKMFGMQDLAWLYTLPLARGLGK